MRKPKEKRIVLSASPQVMKALDGAAQALDTTKAATIRMAVNVLSEVASELSAGKKLVLRDADGNERELWFPALSRSKVSGS